jgi:probable F420-dependent oxidoreductase
MRFTLQLPTDRVQAGREFIAQGAIAEMARAAETAGFEACFVTDHPFPPDRWLAAGGHHALDPFVALSFAGAATYRLRLQTHILVLPYRNPFLLAKAAASLDAVSGGRLILGVAAGYLRAEFAALGADFDGRNAVSDETLAVLKRVWTEDGLHVSGRGYSAEGHTALPKPLQQPHPPIWVGGNSPRAIRRAVELGDGWLPFPAPGRMARFVGTRALQSNEDLERGLSYARGHAAKVGRTAPLDVCFAPLELRDYLEGELSAAAFLDALQHLELLGVTWLTISLPAKSRAAFLDDVARFGEEVIRTHATE